MTTLFSQKTPAQLQAAFNSWQAHRSTRLAQRAAGFPNSSSKVPDPGTLEFRGQGRLVGPSLGGVRTRIDFSKGIDRVHQLGSDKFSPRSIRGDSSVPGFTLLTGYDPDKLLDESGDLVTRRCKCKDKVSFILKRSDAPRDMDYQLRCKKCMGVIKSKCDSTGKPIKGSGK